MNPPGAERSPARGGPYPPGALHVNGFSFFNALSFQIVLGAPVILYAKGLGAGSLVLGVIAALTPLLTTLQLPAARFLHRVGYRRFILLGWGWRTLFTFFIALLPVLPGLPDLGRLALLIFALFCFNLLRGAASGAWLPWLTALIPEDVRGRFLSRDQGFMYVGCLAALLASALVMAGERAQAWQYAAVFLLSAVAALASLWFIRRVPDADSPEQMRRSAVPVPWRAMVAYRPFQRLLAFTLLYMAVIGGLGVFTVQYLAEREKFTEGTILLLSALGFIGALAGLPLAGRRIDATGSRPWLAAALVLLVGVITGWTLLAGEVFEARFWLVGLLNLAGGVSGALFNLANTRIIMGSMPEMGRNHFFALFTVATSLGLGGSPVTWGAMLDSLGTWQVVAGGLEWNRHTVYFAAAGVLALANLLAVAWLRENDRSAQAFDEAFREKCESLRALPE